MKANRLLVPWMVLILAVSALGATIAWAATRDDDGWGMMRAGSGMMGYANTGNGTPVRDLAGARRQAQEFADRLDLRVGEVMQFENNYYAELDDQADRPATEVLVDPDSGSVWLEFGPAMMWNTRYGMMGRSGAAGGAGVPGMMGGGMMGGGMMGGAAVAGLPDPTWAPQAGTAAVSAAEATKLAAQWLGRYSPGVTTDAPEAFPGYFTLHTLRSGEIDGMLSVNARTGAVWYHWWHGRFVAMNG